MSKAFASQADMAEKRETFAELASGVFALTAEGDPNSGVVIGDDSVLVIDARATPVMARELVAHIRKVTDKPIRHVLLTHYHAVRVLGVAGYGYTWPGGRTISPAKARKLVALDGARARWRTGAGEWTARLSDGTRLWWSDARSVALRHELATELGLHGIALWRLGSADPLG